MYDNNADSISVYSSTSVSVIVGILHYSIAQSANRIAVAYEKAGNEMPWITSVLVDSSLYYWAIPIIVGLCFLAHHLGYLSRTTTCLISSATTVGSIFVCAFALYIPIFRMGTLVQ